MATGVGMMGMFRRGDKEVPVVVVVTRGEEDGMIAVKSPAVVEYQNRGGRKESDSQAVKSSLNMLRSGKF